MPRTIAMSVVVLALSVPVGALAQPAALPPTVPAIVTTGEATVRRPPDQAFVTAAVEVRARTPRDAQQQNANGMTTLLQKVTAAGIARDAIRTLGYTIQQEIDFVNGRRVPRDYVARNAIEVRVDAVERAGEILDALVQGGATSVDRVRFDVKDRDAIEREALRLAVADARGRAEAAAAGAGQTIARVLRIEDSPTPDYKGPVPMMAMRAAPEAATTPIEPAVIEVRATVTLTVAIQ